MRFALALALTLTSTPACRFDATVPPDARVRCASDDDCPLDRVCNTDAAACVAPGSDVTAPALESAELTPRALATGVARLVIDANEVLADEAPTLTSAAGALPAFALESVDGSRATLLLDVTDANAVPEGLYAVDAITIADRAGNRATRRVADVTLLVDRTVPLIANASATAPPGGLADVAGRSALAVRFLANEPLVDPTAALGGLTVPCPLAADEPAFACVIDVVGGALPDGSNTLTVAGADLAGNRAERALSVAVDTAPPGIVAGSAVLTIDPPGPAQTAPVAATGARVRVSLLLDEPPALAEVSLVRAGGTLAFDVVVSGARVDATIDALPAVTADEPPAPVTARFIDAFGHESTATVTFDAPFAGGVPFGDATTSGCLHSNTDCIDYDGDGAFASEPSCAIGFDCSDIEPTVFPLAPEIPGDGLDNACDGDADLPIDDASGVFVDADGGDLNGGTGEAPVRTIARALELLGGTRRVLYLRANDTHSADDLITELQDGTIAAIVGGLTHAADGSWHRPNVAPDAAPGSAPTTTLVFGVPVTLGDDVVWDGLEILVTGFGITVADRTVIVRSVVDDPLTFLGRSIVADSTVRNLGVVPTGDVHFTRVAMASTLSVAVQGAASFHRCTIDAPLVVDGGDVVFTSSVVRHPDQAVEVVGGSARIVGSLIEDPDASIQSDPALLRASGDVLVLGTIFHRVGTGILVGHGTGPLTLTACSFGRTGAALADGPLLYEETSGDQAVSPSELDSGTFSGCDACSFVGSHAHVLSGFAGPACAAAVNVELLDVPYGDEIVQQLSSAFADRFGSCRANDEDGVDIGPYEALPGTSCSE